MADFSWIGFKTFEISLEAVDYDIGCAWNVLTQLLAQFPINTALFHA